MRVKVKKDWRKADLPMVVAKEIRMKNKKGFSPIQSFDD